MSKVELVEKTTNWGTGSGRRRWRAEIWWEVPGGSRLQIWKNDQPAADCSVSRPEAAQNMLLRMRKRGDTVLHSNSCSPYSSRSQHWLEPPI
jgi:hypothetical protein